MTCYRRHLKPFFIKVGLGVTPGNRGDVYRGIHETIGVEYKNCSATRKAVKRRIREDEEAFIAQIKKG